MCTSDFSHGLITWHKGRIVEMAVVNCIFNRNGVKCNRYWLHVIEMLMVCDGKRDAKLEP
jgi:hypothetical protein